MSSFTFDLPPDGGYSSSYEEQRVRAALADKVQRIYDAEWERREEEARIAALPRDQVVTLKMPCVLVEGLDQVARSAGLTRSNLLRQIAADYLNFIRANRIEYRGSVLSCRDDPVENARHFMEREARDQ